MTQVIVRNHHATHKALVDAYLNTPADVILGYPGDDLDDAALAAAEDLDFVEQREVVELLAA